MSPSPELEDNTAMSPTPELEDRRRSSRKKSPIKRFSKEVQHHTTIPKKKKTKLEHATSPDVGSSEATAVNAGGTQTSENQNPAAKIKETLRIFNKHYLQCAQEEAERCKKYEGERGSGSKPEVKKKKGRKTDVNKMKKGSKPQGNLSNDNKKKNVSKRPRADLKATSKMREAKEILYPQKICGAIPGIEVGHQFYSRSEMVALGFHGHWIDGIDCISNSVENKQLEQYKHLELPVAISIVISGQYEDDLDNGDEVIYTGQGGNNLKGKQVKDQKMERGNLGLKHSMEKNVPVRVTRGHKCENSYTGRVYTYDGLYEVVRYWAAAGLSDHTVYKFELKRLTDQPPLTTRPVDYIRGSIPNADSEIKGLVCNDISGGDEKIPIPATNLVDDPPMPPTGLTYTKTLQICPSVQRPPKAPGCNCQGSCTNARTCSCAKLNGVNFPYFHDNRVGRLLVEAKAVVYECGPNCGCGPDCVNRTSQEGLKYHLEVFRTAKKGWAVRSWDFIPSGAPLCEYIGVLMKTRDVDTSRDPNYMFDIDCLQTMKGLDGRQRRMGDVSLPSNLQNGDNDAGPEFCIDALSTGNIARFINHSCEPNLFVQGVLSDHRDIKQARLMLFAADHIKPLTELTYDYGYVVDTVLGADGNIRQMECHCGTTSCRKRESDLRY